MAQNCSTVGDKLSIHLKADWYWHSYRSLFLPLTPILEVLKKLQVTFRLRCRWKKSASINIDISLLLSTSVGRSGRCFHSFFMVFLLILNLGKSRFSTTHAFEKRCFWWMQSRKKVNIYKFWYCFGWRADSVWQS